MLHRPQTSLLPPLNSPPAPDRSARATGATALAAPPSAAREPPQPQKRKPHRPLGPGLRPAHPKASAKVMQSEQIDKKTHTVRPKMSPSMLSSVSPASCSLFANWARCSAACCVLIDRFAKLARAAAFFCSALRAAICSARRDCSFWMRPLGKSQRVSQKKSKNI
jgi:hypothetical protein